MGESYSETLAADEVAPPGPDDRQQTAGDILAGFLVVGLLMGLALFLAIPVVHYLGRFGGIDSSGTTVMIVTPLGIALVGAGYSGFAVLRRQAKTAIWTMLGAIGLVILAGLMTISFP